MIATMLTHQFDRLPPEPILKAWQDWFTAHGIDYNEVPVDAVIERQVDEHRVAYEAFVCGPDGELVRGGDGYTREVRYVQLDAVPLPFPSG